MKINKFVIEAASDDMKEVRLGKMAELKGTSKYVKDYGRTLIKDHSKSVEDLKEVAKNNDIKFPHDLNENHKKKVQEFRKTDNLNFDNKFLQYMIQDHEEDIQDFEEEVKSEKNEDVKNWAQKNIPVLKKHLDIARNLSSKPEININDISRYNTI